MKKFVQKLWKDESGQGTAEYVLLLAIIAGVLVVFGPKIKGFFESKTSSVMDQLNSVGGQ